VINRFEFEGVAGNIPVINANNLQGQLHAKVGFGFKPESGVMIIPSIETPILNIQPFEDGKSTLPYFNSRYRPIIISVRFLFFAQTKPEDCVGQGTEKRGTELWGKEMRKTKKKKKRSASLLRAFQRTTLPKHDWTILDAGRQSIYYQPLLLASHESSDNPEMSVGLFHFECHQQRKQCGEFLRPLIQ